MSIIEMQELRALVAEEVRRVLAGPTPQPARVFTTRDAARYVGYRSADAIRKARLEGRLVALGRRGGRGPWMLAHEALDDLAAGRLPRGAIYTSVGRRFGG
jgi:hypothetical protein